MHSRLTESPIGYVEHKRKTKKGETVVQVPVFGVNYFDDTRYPRGKLKPNMRAVPDAPSDLDIAHIAAAIAKRERKAKIRWHSWKSSAE